MKCPLFMIHILQEPGKVDLAKVDCLKGECAWWDEGSSACAIWSIMSGFDALGKVLRDIEKKMPHEGQVRK